jgi:hypothetical protein
MRKLHIIDCLGPFIEKSDQKTINWSKVIFSDLEVNGRLSRETQDRIARRFETYLQRVTGLGYDSISIDDLAHLASFPFYKPKLRTLLTDYHGLYKRLFAIAKAHGVKIFVNTDYLFYNQDIHHYLEENRHAKADFYVEVLEKVFQTFPEIDGVILRIGEEDGTDVKGSFLSKLALRSPKQANALLKKILPVFEKNDKTLIFRTWSVGVYKIGDLIWNEKTFDTVFSSIKSDALIISMKFGDTDFMRFLPLNPLFFKGSHKKIIEFQTRREWEGMGTYPSFVGWEYQKYLSQLAKNKTIVGIHVWCQTGGWAKNSWSNVTYLDGSSFWNELNTEVTIHLYKHSHSVQKAVALFCRTRTIKDVSSFLQLLRLADKAIMNGLYLRELGEKQLYFRRSRIPPLMWLTWDKALLQPSIIHLLRLLVSQPQEAIQQAHKAVEAAEEMLHIGQKLPLPQDVIGSLRFEHATLVIFTQLRRYILTHISPDELSKLNKAVATYRAAYPQHYSIPTLRAVPQKRRFPRQLLNIFLRESAPYRKRDKVIFATSRIQRKIISHYLRKSKSHLANQSMGLEVLFK